MALPTAIHQADVCNLKAYSGVTCNALDQLSLLQSMLHTEGHGYMATFSTPAVAVQEEQQMPQLHLMNPTPQCSRKLHF
jgi:hypothetical protein